MTDKLPEVKRYRSKITWENIKIKPIQGGFEVEMDHTRPRFIMMPTATFKKFIRDFQELEEPPEETNSIYPRINIKKGTIVYQEGWGSSETCQHKVETKSVDSQKTDDFRDKVEKAKEELKAELKWYKNIESKLEDEEFSSNFRHIIRATQNLLNALDEQEKADETEYLKSSPKTYETINHSLKSKDGTKYRNLEEFDKKYEICKHEFDDCEGCEFEEESVADKRNFEGFKPKRTAIEALTEKYREEFYNRWIGQPEFEDGKKQVETEKKIKEEKCAKCGKLGHALCEDATINHEKPQSIWKDVSELPKFNKEVGFPDVVIKFNDGNIRRGILQYDFLLAQNRSMFNQKNISQYCLLKDFVNSFEDLQERVRKLETK